MILSRQKEENAWFAVILTAGSMELADSIAFAGQDEVAYILTFAICLYFRLKGKRKSSLAWGIVTVTLCPFMIVPYIVMEMYYDKRVWVLLLKFSLTILPSILFNLAYSHNEIYQSLKNVNSLDLFYAMSTTLTMTTAVGVSSVSLALLVLVVFCAYVNKENDDHQVMWYICLSFFVLQFLMYNIFYRYCVYVPFLAVLLASSDKNRKMKTFLFFILSLVRFISGFSYPGRYAPICLTDYMLNFVPDVSKVFFEATAELPSLILTVCHPLVIACIVLLLGVGFNKNNREYDIELTEKVSIPLYMLSYPIFMCIWAIWLFA